MNYVENMTGSLMIVHGLIDENVHFRNTARLINALIKARKRYQLLLFPDERHMPRRLEDRTFMEENIRDFFLRELS
jgi:dipeptidyl-peptidase-4